MYLTRGAKVSTRRSRTARSLVRRYSFQSASVSSEERRRLEVWAVARLIRRWLLGAGGTLDVSVRRRTFRIPNVWYRASGHAARRGLPTSGEVGCRTSIERTQTCAWVPIRLDTRGGVRVRARSGGRVRVPPHPRADKR